MSSSEEIKPVVLSIVELLHVWLKTSVSQRVEIQLNRKIFKNFQNNLLEGLGTFLGLAMPILPHYSIENVRLIWVMFLGRQPPNHHDP